MRVWYVGVRVMLVTPSVGSMQMCKDEQQRARMQHSIESASGHLLLGDSLLLLRDSLCRPAAGTATQTCFRGSYRQPAAHGRVDKLLQMKGRTQTRDQSRAGGVERKRRQATGTGGRRKAAAAPLPPPDGVKNAAIMKRWADLSRLLLWEGGT